jgi:hypothetical protein
MPRYSQFRGILRHLITYNSDSFLRRLAISRIGPFCPIRASPIRIHFTRSNYLQFTFISQHPITYASRLFPGASICDPDLLCGAPLFGIPALFFALNYFGPDLFSDVQSLAIHSFYGTRGFAVRPVPAALGYHECLFFCAAPFNCGCDLWSRVRLFAGRFASGALVICALDSFWHVISGNRILLRLRSIIDCPGGIVPPRRYSKSRFKAKCWIICNSRFILWSFAVCNSDFLLTFDYVEFRLSLKTSIIHNSDSFWAVR